MSMSKSDRKGTTKNQIELSPILRYGKPGNSSINCFQFYGDYLLAGSADTKIRFYHIDSTQCVKTYHDHDSQVSGLQIHNSHLYSANQKGDIIVYNLQNDKKTSVFNGHTNKISSLTIDSYERLFSGSSDHTVKLWNIKNGNIIQDFSEHTDIISQISIPNETTLYSSSIDRTLKSWDIETGKVVNNYDSHKGWVLTFHYDKESKLLYSGSQDSTIKVWDTRLNKCIHTFQGHKFAVSQVLVNGSNLISSSWDGNIGLWNLKNKKKSPFFLKGHIGQVRGIYLTNNQILYSFSNDTSVRVWNVKKRICKSIFKGHSKPIFGFKFDSKDRLFSCSKDGTINRWPASKNQRVSSILMEKEEVDQMQSTLLLQGLHSDVEIFINDRPYWTTTDETIFKVCKSNGIQIFSFCYHSRLSPIGICGFCSVEILNNFGEHEIVSACSYQCRENLKVWTNTNKVKMHIQRAIIALDNKQKINNIFNKHSHNNINNNHNNHENNLLSKYFNEIKDHYFFTDKSNSIQLDYSKCVDCGRCVQACKELMGLKVFNMKMDVPDLEGCTLQTNNKQSLINTNCIDCGQCTLFCPTDALTEINDDFNLVKEKLKDENCHIVLAISPEIILSLPELLEIDHFENYNLNDYNHLEKIFLNLLKILGFDNIFNLELALNLSHIDETLVFYKLIEKNEKNIPLISSYCPSWKKLCEKKYPKLFKYFSNVDSPFNIFGLLSKTIYAKRMEIDPKNIFTVILTACIPAKGELNNRSNLFKNNKNEGNKKKNENNNNNNNDNNNGRNNDNNGNDDDILKKVNAILTLREIKKLMNEKNININEIKKTNYKFKMDKNLKYLTLFKNQKFYNNSIKSMQTTGSIRSIIECYKQIIKRRRKIKSNNKRVSSKENFKEPNSDPEQIKEHNKKKRIKKKKNVFKKKNNKRP